MNKKLLRSVREYKKQSVLAPVLVILEVLCWEKKSGKQHRSIRTEILAENRINIYMN